MSNLLFNIDVSICFDKYKFFNDGFPGFPI